ncbi:DUF3429 family protein [Rhodosalinus sediminis]|uniref:DUF3429 family protein n=2 Tax=Rhodosalinus sediminis TaxID=1940533 RepID=A0A3D9BZ57_9RHOB|nr:DUF3429 family protein [Rhodosalinus sediminis]
MRSARAGEPGGPRAPSPGMADAARTVIVHETARPPRGGLWLAALAVVPLLLAVPALWLLPGDLVREAARLWAAALTLFFSGVRRGLSFRTEGGATGAQMTAFAGLFAAGLAALLLPPVAALWLLAAALGALALVDPRAAERGEVPIWFAGLRAVQMPVAAVALAALALL